MLAEADCIETKLIQSLFAFRMHCVSLPTLRTNPNPKIEGYLNMAVGNATVTFACFERCQRPETFFPRLLKRIPNESDGIQSLNALSSHGRFIFPLNTNPLTKSKAVFDMSFRSTAVPFARVET